MRPVAFSVVQHIVELMIHWSSYSKSCDYLVGVAKEIIRKRRESMNDPTHVKVCMYVCMYVRKCALYTCMVCSSPSASCYRDDSYFNDVIVMTTCIIIHIHMHAINIIPQRGYSIYI